MVQLLRYILFPFSLVYAGAVYVRNILFDIGLFKSEVFSIPIIVVGNLSTGGTGKTPMVAYLIELLSPEHKIAVLSRGYKRKSKGFVLADGTSTVSKLGDEPFQIAKKYPHVKVAVDANRRNGIRELEKQKTIDLIILDDAYQHRWVKPSLSLLLTAYGKLYPNDWYLPTGNLRDTKNQSKRADVIVVTKCPEFPESNKKEQLLRTLNPLTGQNVIFGRLKYEYHFIGLKEKLSFDALKEKKVALVTGIANADPLVSFLEKKGVSFEHLNFADHHNFSETELQKFNAYDIILTTEKDFVRFEDTLPNAYYLGVKHEFSSGDKEVILNAVKKIIRSAPRPSS